MLINREFEYTAILLVIFIATFFLKYIFGIKFFTNLKQGLIFWIILYLVGIVWDTFAISRGHWFYPEGGSLGIKIGLIPIEDYIFVFVCGFFALTLYKILERTSK